MPEPLIALLAGASLASLTAYLYWTARQRPDHRHRRDNEAEAYCTWCVYRHRDVCIHPGSPVYPGECGPVNTGRIPCEVRVLKWRPGS